MTLLGADGRPLNTSLSHFGKTVELAPGTSAPSQPELSLTVNADERPATPASLQQAGEAYRPTARESASMEPAIRCPHCQQVCVGFGSAQPEFQIPDLPIDLVRYVYRADPCGCTVTQEWVGAINAEINHRQSGGKPRPVVDMTDGQRKSLYERLEKLLHQYMDESAKWPDKNSPHAHKLANLTQTVLTVMQYVAEPMRDKTGGSSVVKAVVDALKTEKKANEQAPYEHKPQNEQYQRAKDGLPSRDLLTKAIKLLLSADWEGAIAGTFLNLTTPEQRQAIRSILRDSIHAHLLNVANPLHPAVHKYLYFITYGTREPIVTASGGISGAESINKKPAFTPATPAAGPVDRPVPGVSGGVPGTRDVVVPATKPADFHKQFERKKRRVRRIERDDET